MTNKKEELLQSMFEATARGLCLVRKNYQVALFNATASALYKKVTSAQLYEGLDFLSIFTPERAGVVRKAIDAAFAGEITEYEVRYATPQQTWIKVRYSPAYGHDGKCTGICLINEDITDKKALEAAAKAEELKFMSLFYFSGIGMALVSAEGKLMDVNPAFAKITGYSREELLQLSFQEITHPADVAADVEFARQVLAKERETYQMEKRYYHKNGSIVWVILTVSPVRGYGETPDYLIGQVVDITSVKAMIRELEAKNNALDFAAHDLESKIQQLEDFTHMAGHNLRGPAANISGLAGLLRDSSPEALPGMLDILQQAADSLLANLNELLKFSQVKLEAGLPYVDCDIKALCEEVLSEIAATDVLGNTVVRYQLGFGVLSYPKIYLQSILYNLLSNAFKYRRNDIPLIITIKTEEADGRRRLSVTDNGTGFDMKKHKDSIFRLNSTFHRGYNSRGIGLYITKAQIEKLGGEISVESKVNEGATFTVLF